jgi:hypothetical protein
MNLDDYINSFQSFENQTESKAEKRIFQEYIKLLQGVKKKSLTKDQNAKLIKYLKSKSFENKDAHPKKYYRVELNKLIEFLKKEFSFVPINYFTNIWMLYGIMFGSGLGLTFSSAFGSGVAIALGLSMGLSLGMIIGIVYGKVKDKEAQERGLVLNG